MTIFEVFMAFVLAFAVIKFLGIDKRWFMNNFEKITINASELAIAIMGTDVLANIQRRTLEESVIERLTNDEVLKRNIEYFKQWLESEAREWHVNVTAFKRMLIST